MRTDRYADQRSLIADTPAWVPEAVQTYLAHTEAGLTIRELARIAGCHASTVLRQVRRLESRRDDPLVDAALHNLGARFYREGPPACAGVLKIKDGLNMNEPGDKCETSGADDIAHDALRVLRRMCEKGAVLAVAGDLDKAVVVRDGTQRTAVVDRGVAEAMALKDWISADGTGRIIRYRITSTGRAALTQMLRDAGEEPMTDGFAEARVAFSGQTRPAGERCGAQTEEDTATRRTRYNLSESPLTALARRRDKDGTRFLSGDLVRAGERLREDFELANMGPQVAQNWDRFLTAGAQGSAGPDGGIGHGPEAARRRVSGALSDLGPGLSDVVLRCCCYLEGLETAEKRLGWSARSGKIVLRIALMRLKRHYDEVSEPGGGMIG